MVTRKHSKRRLELWRDNSWFIHSALPIHQFCVKIRRFPLASLLPRPNSLRFFLLAKLKSVLKRSFESMIWIQIHQWHCRIFQKRLSSTDVWTGQGSIICRLNSKINQRLNTNKYFFLFLKVPFPIFKFQF